VGCYSRLAQSIYVVPQTPPGGLMRDAPPIARPRLMSAPTSASNVMGTFALETRCFGSGSLRAGAFLQSDVAVGDEHRGQHVLLLKMA